MTSFECFIEGIPKPQGSYTYYGKGKIVPVSKDLKAWRSKIKTTAINTLHAMGKPTPLFDDEPVSVRFDFIIPRPKTVKRALPHVRPDLDKYVRAANDALTMAGVFKDDGQVCLLQASKKYVSSDHPMPGVYVLVYRSFKK